MTEKEPESADTLNFSGHTCMLYSGKAGEQLEHFRRKFAYNSRFWITEDELQTIRTSHTLDLKENQTPSIIFEPIPKPQYISLFNADQFTDPNFVKLWALTARFRGKAVDTSALKWKAIGKLLRKGR